MQLIGEAQKMYASYGVTTVQDGMVGKPLFELLKYASANGLLKLDVVGYADIMTAQIFLRKKGHTQTGIPVI